MNEFIGRKKELSALQSRYESPGFQMVVMYGRRRVGKSTLIQHFIQGKKAIFYTAIRSGLQRNVELLGNRILENLAPHMPGISFANIDQIFTFLTAACQHERIILVLDEFPYLAEQDPSILSILQKYIDTEWLQGNMFLILCGSSVSFMEHEVLSEKSPLFGRRTGQIHLKPFNYLEAAAFVPQYTYEEKAICYGITGGIAKYLALLDKKKSLDQNIIDLFFSTAGYMYEEPTNLLTQEFRHISSYNAIIDAVSSGKYKPTDIHDATHLELSSISHALRNLTATGIIKKNYAITDERNKRKIRYTLGDHMFQFWYRFVPNGIDLIEMGRGETYYDTIVRPHLSDYMGSIFEDMCRYYTLYEGVNRRFAGSLITQVGTWWGTNPSKKEETDIDVVGLDKIAKTAVLGECKFKNEVIDKSVFMALKERNGLIDHRYRTIHYLLFSKSGFSDWILEHKKEEQIYPITLEDMYKL